MPPEARLQPDLSYALLHSLSGVERKREHLLQERPFIQETKWIKQRD